MLSKLPNVPMSIFAKMSKLAATHNAINLSQGFPDFKSSEVLIELVAKAMKDGFNQYAPMQGLLSLRESIAHKIKQLYNYSYNPDSEITITAGGTQAIFTIITAFVHPGDEVIIFAPAYDCYSPSIALNGGKVVEIVLSTPDYHVPWEKVKAQISDKTRMIIINSPHNPTGALLSKEDMKELEGIVQNTNIIVLSDEVYEHIIFDKNEHQSVARFPELAKNSFLVASFGKTFHNTGWKMGYCAAPEELMSEFRKVHQFNVFNVNHPIQVALAEYLKEPGHYLALPDFYQSKRDYFLKLIGPSSFKFKPTSGTYFQLLYYDDITQENDEVFADRLTSEFRIASIPVSVFYETKLDQKVLRFCFAKKDETLEMAAEIINRIK
ncbi:MAG: methionine aminotransferase [Flavobacteriaceae bacterium]|nr:methionine aminotransferase [Flavobacteriaceae bacterium]